MAPKLSRNRHAGARLPSNPAKQACPISEPSASMAAWATTATSCRTLPGQSHCKRDCHTSAEKYRGSLVRGCAERKSGSGQEMLRQRADIFLAVPQRWNVDANGIQIVVQPRVKAVLDHRSLQIARAGGDHSGLRRDRDTVFPASAVAALQSVQQLHLGPERELRHPVKE